ncbi:hypothetical protein HPB48_006376 [Haemaphysalis longicornis]|uniref:Uncharacterized protein n=1 Tax=Haemaphysalis longicornis TaxID=44386 RepID=A0A9J6FAG0_HAELO|nr:hypothetical protein HPB48_006376 [Haemaphysalis longicornis]
MFDVRPGFYPPLERKSLHGSVSVLNALPPPGGPPPLPMGPPPFLPPPHLMPPMMRPRPYVFPAEPLPTRDPFRSKTPVLQPPKMEQDYYSVDQVYTYLSLHWKVRWCSIRQLSRVSTCDFRRELAAPRLDERSTDLYWPDL